MTMRAPRYQSGSVNPLPPHIQYEVQRARAGNVLFCPVSRVGLSRAAGMPPLYEDAAQLLKLLVAHGLQLGNDYHNAIVSMADAFFVSASLDASGAYCAEYVLYCLQGMPKFGAQKTESKLRAMIGTFYTNLRTTRSIGTR